MEISEITVRRNSEKFIDWISKCVTKREKLKQELLGLLTKKKFTEFTTRFNQLTSEDRKKAPNRSWMPTQYCCFFASGSRLRRALLKLKSDFSGEETFHSVSDISRVDAKIQWLLNIWYSLESVRQVRRCSALKDKTQELINVVELLSKKTNIYLQILNNDAEMEALALEIASEPKSIDSIIRRKFPVQEWPALLEKYAEKNGSLTEMQALRKRFLEECTRARSDVSFVKSVQLRFHVASCVFISAFSNSGFNEELFLNGVEFRPDPAAKAQLIDRMVGLLTYPRVDEKIVAWISENFKSKEQSPEGESATEKLKSQILAQLQTSGSDAEKLSSSTSEDFKPSEQKKNVSQNLRKLLTTALQQSSDGEIAQLQKKFLSFRIVETVGHYRSLAATNSKEKLFDELIAKLEDLLRDETLELELNFCNVEENESLYLYLTEHIGKLIQNLSEHRMMEFYSNNRARYEGVSEKEVAKEIQIREELRKLHDRLTYEEQSFLLKQIHQNYGVTETLITNLTDQGGVGVQTMPFTAELKQEFKNIGTLESCEDYTARIKQLYQTFMAKNPEPEPQSGYRPTDRFGRNLDVSSQISSEELTRRVKVKWAERAVALVCQELQKIFKEPVRESVLLQLKPLASVPAPLRIESHATSATGADGVTPSGLSQSSPLVQ